MTSPNTDHRLLDSRGNGRRRFRSLRLLGDLRHALRSFRRHPAVPALAVAILALGLGGFLALWSAADAVLWRPLPYRDPERLVRIWGSGNGLERSNLNPLDAEDYRARARSFDGFAVFNANADTVAGLGAPEYLPVGRVSAEFFSTLGVEPALGRFFQRREETLGEHRVAVLSWELWQSHFHGAQDVIGRSFRIDEQPYVVVGVAPAGLMLPVPDTMQPPALYRPFAYDHAKVGRGGHWVTAVARLRPGVDLARAQAEIDGIQRQIAAEQPDSDVWTIQAEPLRAAMTRTSRPALTLLVAATALLLLLACGNVAALLLARATTRASELAVRGALGATRGALVRQLLLEVLVLGAAAGAGGVAVAKVLLAGLRALGAGQVPMLDRAAIDGRALAMGLLATLATVAVAGAAPALHSVRAAFTARATASRETRWLEQVLVAAQLALCLTLLVGAALLGRSLERLYRVEPGFQTAHAATFGLYLVADRYSGVGPARAFFPRLEERLARLPGVEAVGSVDSLPLGGGYNCNSVLAEGSVRLDPEQEPCAESRVATPGYFAAMGLHLVAGRTFTAADGETAPVVVVTESFARNHWPGRSPLGRRMKWGEDESSDDVWRTVVGVVRDVRHFGLDAPARPEVYMTQQEVANSGLEVVVRTRADEAALFPALRRAVAEIDPALPLARLRRMDDLLADSTAARRLRTWTFGGFAALALVLAVAGLYGSLAHAVGARRRELSVRMAVGAGKRQIVGLVLGEGAALTAVGILGGGAGALAAARALRQLLFGVEPLDVASFAGAAVLLCAVAFVAAWLPARRAAGVDPVRALRGE